MNDPLSSGTVAHCYHGRVPTGHPALATNLPVSVTAATTPGGTFDPAGSIIPGDLADANSIGAMGETTIWAVGEFVVLGDGSHAYWGGAGLWVEGEAPA